MWRRWRNALRFWHFILLVGRGPDLASMWVSLGAVVIFMRAQGSSYYYYQMSWLTDNTREMSGVYVLCLLSHRSEIPFRRLLLEVS